MDSCPPSEIERELRGCPSHPHVIALSGTPPDFVVAWPDMSALELIRRGLTRRRELASDLLHSGDLPPRWLSPLNFTEILSHKTPVRASHPSSYLCIPTEQVDRARDYPDRIRCSECTNNFVSA